MEYSGISKMLIDWVKSFVGRVRGATGIITTCACMAFGVLTGSAMATISAIGKMMVPELEKEGYPHGYSSALLAATCFLGILIPPSVPGIMYALASGAKITPVWMSTIGPAFIFAIGYFIINYFRIGRHQARPEKVEFHPTAKLLEIGKSTIYAIPALLMPIIIIGGVMGGAFTATEAGAVACVYGLIVSVFVYKSMSFKDLINVLRSASVNMAMVMMIIGFSSIFSYIFALEGMGQKIVDFMLSITTSPTGLFFLVIAFMVVIGCFMESLAALPIILPIIYPMFASLGVNLNQLGVVFALSTVLGGLTPPVGIYLFLSMNLTGAKMKETVLPHMLIVIGIMLLVIVLCILLPIPQFLPDLVFGAAT